MVFTCVFVSIWRAIEGKTGRPLRFSWLLLIYISSRVMNFMICVFYFFGPGFRVNPCESSSFGGIGCCCCCCCCPWFLVRKSSNPSYFLGDLPILLSLSLSLCFSLSLSLSLSTLL